MAIISTKITRTLLIAVLLMVPLESIRGSEESILIALIIAIPLILILFLLVGIVIFYMIRSRSKKETGAEEDDSVRMGTDFDNDPDIDLIYK